MEYQNTESTNNNLTIDETFYFLCGLGSTARVNYIDNNLSLVRSSPKLLKFAAEEFLKHDRTDEAKKLIEECLLIGELQNNNLILFKDIYFPNVSSESERTRRTINHFEKINRGSLNCDLLLAKCYLDISNHKKAIEYYDKAIGRDSNKSIQICLMKASVQEKNGLLADAESSYEDAIDLAEKEGKKQLIAMAYEGASEFYRKQGETQTAIDYLNLAPIEKDSQQRKHHQRKIDKYSSDIAKNKLLSAQDFYKNEDYDSALDFYCEAISLDPNIIKQPADHKKIITCYHEVDEYEKAVEYYNDIPKGIKTEDSDMTEIAAKCALKAGAYEQAIECCESILESSNKKSEIFYSTLQHKADALICLGKYEKALAICEEALEIIPSDLSYRDAVFCLLETQNYKKALEYLQDSKILMSLFDDRNYIRQEMHEMEAEALCGLGRLRKSKDLNSEKFSPASIAKKYLMHERDHECLDYCTRIYESEEIEEIDNQSEKDLLCLHYAASLLALGQFEEAIEISNIIVDEQGKHSELKAGIISAAQDQNSYEINDRESSLCKFYRRDLVNTDIMARKSTEHGMPEILEHIQNMTDDATQSPDSNQAPQNLDIGPYVAEYVEAKKSAHL